MSSDLITVRHVAALADIRSFIRYDPLSGKLFWTKSPNSCTHIGAEAGFRTERGYVQFGFRRMTWQAHRVAWFLHIGTWAAEQIDHRNRDKSDNRWVNLRTASPSQNNCNSVRPAGKFPKGVKASGSSYTAGIRYRNIDYYLGLFRSPDDAHAAYCAAAKRLHGEFARFE